MSDIWPDAVRMQLCWDNSGGPHYRDIPLKEIIGVFLSYDAQGYVYLGRPDCRLKRVPFTRQKMGVNISPLIGQLFVYN